LVGVGRSVPVAKFLTGLKRSIRTNGAGFAIALIGIGGSFLGAYYGSSSQFDLWRREKLFQYELDILNKRIDLIRSITKSNVAAQRVSLLMAGINQEASLLAAKIEQCKTPNLDAQTLTYCSQDVKQAIDLNTANKEISDLQSDYFANLQLAGIYFCAKTRSTLVDLQKDHKDWWEIDASKRDNVVVVMGSELFCNISFENILK
jgi:hypothetical protein